MHLCCRFRTSRSYTVVKTADSSAAFVNRRVDSPSDSETGGQQDDIVMQTIDPKSTLIFILCACMCVFVCVYVFTCVYVYVCVHVRMYMYVCTCVCVCVSACVHV